MPPIVTVVPDCAIETKVIGTAGPKTYVPPRSRRRPAATTCDTASATAAVSVYWQYASGLRDVTVLPTGERPRPGRTRGDQRDATGIMPRRPRCLFAVRCYAGRPNSSGDSPTPSTGIAISL